MSELNKLLDSEGRVKENVSESKLFEACEADENMQFTYISHFDEPNAMIMIAIIDQYDLYLFYDLCLETPMEWYDNRYWK